MPSHKDVGRETRKFWFLKFDDVSKMKVDSFINSIFFFNLYNFLCFWNTMLPIYWKDTFSFCNDFNIFHDNLILGSIFLNKYSHRWMKYLNCCYEWKITWCFFILLGKIYTGKISQISIFQVFQVMGFFITPWVVSNSTIYRFDFSLLKIKRTINYCWIISSI